MYNKSQSIVIANDEYLRYYKYKWEYKVSGCIAEWGLRSQGGGSVEA